MKNNKKALTNYLPLGLAMSALLIGFNSNAQLIYKRVDAQGRIIYSDSISPNIKERYETYSPRSLTLQKITDRELTESEYLLAEREQKVVAKAKQDQEIQNKKDEALLRTYNNVEDIARMKKFELNQLDTSIKNDIEMLARLNDTNTTLSEQVASTKDIANARLLGDRVSKNEKDISVLKENIDRNRKLYVEKETKYNSDKIRFEEVTKKNVSKVEPKTEAAPAPQ